MTLSLLDLEGKSVADWWVVFRDLVDADQRSWFWRLLKPGHQHCELWKFERGVYIRVEPCMELIEVEVYAAPPWQLISPAVNPTYLRVNNLVRHQRIREPFHIGPWTCVEMTKAFLGLRAFFVRTPWQLHKKLRKERWGIRSVNLAKR